MLVRVLRMAIIICQTLPFVDYDILHNMNTGIFSMNRRSFLGGTLAAADESMRVKAVFDYRSHEAV